MGNEITYKETSETRYISTELIDKANFDLLCWVYKDMRKKQPNAIEMSITVRGTVSDE